MGLRSARAAAFSYSSKASGRSSYTAPPLSSSAMISATVRALGSMSNARHIWIVCSTRRRMARSSIGFSSGRGARLSSTASHRLSRGTTGSASTERGVGCPLRPEHRQDAPLSADGQRQPCAGRRFGETRPAQGCPRVATDLEPMRAEKRQVRIRARPAARKRWEEAAALRGESLSEFLRIAADERASRQPEEEVLERWLSPQTQPARARAKTLEERLAAIGELVD